MLVFPPTLEEKQSHNEKHADNPYSTPKREEKHISHLTGRLAHRPPTPPKRTFSPSLPPPLLTQLPCQLCCPLLNCMMT